MLDILGIVVSGIVVLAFVYLIIAVVRINQREKEKRTILSEITAWAKRHPSPTQPCLFLGSITLAPEDIPKQLEHRTEVGLLLWEIIEAAKSNGGGIESILIAFRRS